MYWQKAGESAIGHELKALVMNGHHEMLEGDPIEGMAILEFPSVEAAKNWYESPAYQAVRKPRVKGAVYRGFIVAGV